jgi:ribosomal protein L37AE/L43A
MPCDPNERERPVRCKRKTCFACIMAAAGRNDDIHPCAKCGAGYRTFPYSSNVWLCLVCSSSLAREGRL